ncbi:MAG: MFS transporter [Verrucomicrobiales bacterium]
MSDPNTTPTADHHAPGEIESPDWKSTWCVLVVQAQNAFNDKFAQFALLGLAGVLLPNLKEVYPHIVSMLLVIPFVALAPVAGWTSDRFSKRAVIFACLIAQIAILAGIAVSVWAGSLYVATAWFFLLAVQSTFFSPAKMGILKELVGSKKLAEVSGWMQMLTIIAIILGTVAGGQAFDRLAGNQTEVAAAVPPALEHSAADPSATSAGGAGEAATLPPPSPEKAERSSKAAAISVGGILFFAFIALAVVRPVKRTEPHPTEKFTARLLGRHFVHLREVWRDAPLQRCAAGITFFWFSGVTIALILIEAGKIVAGGEAGSTSASGIMLACSGGGVALGSLLTSWISRNSIELGIVPIGGAGMALGLLAAVFAAPTDPSSPAAFYVALTLIGIFSAMFLVPLYAYVQDRSDPARRGRILSAINLLDTLGGVIAVGAQLLMMKLKMPIAYQFAFLFALALFASIYVFRLLPQNAVRFALLLVFRVIYRVSARGTGNLPAQGGALLIANHVSFVDAFAISAASDRPIRFVIFDTYYQNPIFRPFLRLFGAVPISPTRAKDAINATADAVKAGDLVCIFPEGQLTRTGCVNEIRRGFELIARAAGHPVIPVYMDGLWGSVFSFERGRYFWKVPRGIPYRVSVAFGAPMAAREATAAKAREAIEWLGADLFAGRPAFQKPLARALVESLSRRTWKACAIDLGSKSGIARGWGAARR